MSIIERSNSENRKSFHLNRNQIFAFGLSIGLGLVLGFLSSQGNWLYALVFAMLAPMAILFTARPFIGVILWLLLMPLSSALPNPELMYWIIHRVLIPVTIIISILPYLINMEKNKSFRMKLPDICILIMTVYVLFSLAISGVSERQLYMKFLDRMLIPFLMYFVIRLSPLDKNNIKILEWTVFVVAAIQNIIGFASWTIPSALPQVWHHNIGYRTAGSLGDPAVFTSLLVFCAVILINAAMKRKNDLIRIMYILVSGLSFVGVFISLERGSWLAGLLVLLGLVSLYRMRMMRLIIIGGVILIIFGIGFLSTQVSMAADRLNHKQPIYDRIVVTDAMVSMVIEKPIFGWGYETLDSHIWGFYRQVGAAAINFGLITSHNSYFTIITEMGFVGIILYILPVIWLVLYSHQMLGGLPKMEKNTRFLLYTFWLAGLHNFIVSNLMDMRWFPIGLTLWWMTLGLISNIISGELSDYQQKFLNKESLINVEYKGFGK